MILLLVLGILHHIDHILRHDHSGWPFTNEITPFTYSLVVYPLIATLFLVKNRIYRVIVAVVLAIALLGLHIFLETPGNQYHMWAYNESNAADGAGMHNLLSIQSPVLGVLAVCISMFLNIGVVILPFVFWRTKNR